MTSVRRADLQRDAYINLHLCATSFAAQFEQDFRPFGLTQAQFTVLWVACLDEDPAGVPVGRIADGLLTKRGDATRLVDRLVAAGLVERRHAEHDRRVVLVKPTRAGRRLFARVAPLVAARHSTQWHALSTDELATLNDLLTKALWSAASPQRREERTA